MKLTIAQRIFIVMVIIASILGITIMVLEMKAVFKVMNLFFCFF